jgi:hypothetical protein
MEMVVLPSGVNAGHAAAQPAPSTRLVALDKASPSAPYLHPGGLAQLRVVTQGPVAGPTDSDPRHGGGSSVGGGGGGGGGGATYCTLRVVEFTVGVID